MPKVLEKVERRLGEKLLLKASRCGGPKCAVVRRAYPPGSHGKGGRRRAPSEFGQLMREKQKVKFLYGLDDKDVKRYSRVAAAGQGVFTANFIQLLESRLDNVVFRLGFTESRRNARQAVSHGHITVNGKAVTIPSYRVRVEDIIAVKERSFGAHHFSNIEERLKKYEPPSWLNLDKNKKSGVVIQAPAADDLILIADVTKVKEYYSR